MKSVLIVIDSLRGGGAERVLFTYLQYWDKKKYSITVVPIVDGGRFSPKVKAIRNICFSPVISSSKSTIRKYINKVLYKLIYYYLSPKIVYSFFIPKNNDIEIAFCEGFVTKLIANSTNRKSKKIAWIHTDIVNNDWPVSIGVYKNREEEISTYSRFDSIVGVSQIVCSSFIKSFGLTNISCIYNPLDKDYIKGLFSTFNKSNHDTIRIISIGRLVYDKGFDLLIEALGALQDDGMSFDLTILGEGPLHKDLEGMITANNLKESVHLVGFQDNPYSFLYSADIYVSSSRYEGFSLAIAEAMIVGLPIVATKCAGPQELLKNGEFGMMVDCSVKGLTSGLREMIINKEMRNSYKNRSIHRGEYFNVDRSLALSEKIFDE